MKLLSHEDVDDYAAKYAARIEELFPGAICPPALHIKIKEIILNIYAEGMDNCLRTIEGRD